MLVLVLPGQSLAYDGCPGDIDSYVYTGLSEQWRCKGQCISVDKPCGTTCYQGRKSWTNFHLWEDQTCVRSAQWYQCDNSTGVIGSYCGRNPYGAGCQPLQVPCGGACPGGKYYQNWWLCSSGDQCVLSAQVCSGYGPYCKDGSDQALSTCSSNSFTKCLTVRSGYPLARSQQCTGGRTMQCIVPSNTGIDCIDRSDSEEKDKASHNNTDNLSLIHI